MEVSKQYRFALARPELWEKLMDVQFVAHHLEGIDDLIELGEDAFEGTMRVKMGPVKFSFKGQVAVTERNVEDWVGVLQANAKDGKTAGGFKASLVMRLTEFDTPETELDITLDTSFIGRIGEFGRPLIKKKIGSMMDDFAASIDRQLADLNQEPER